MQKGVDGFVIKCRQDGVSGAGAWQFYPVPTRPASCRGQDGQQCGIEAAVGRGSPVKAQGAKARLLVRH